MVPAPDSLNVLTEGQTHNQLPSRCSFPTYPEQLCGFGHKVKLAY